MTARPIIDARTGRPVRREDIGAPDRLVRAKATVSQLIADRNHAAELAEAMLQDMANATDDDAFDRAANTFRDAIAIRNSYEGAIRRVISNRRHRRELRQLRKGA